MMDKQAILALYELPLINLVYQAQSVHRQHFDPNEIQISTLLSVKTGACPEDCGYCSQSVHHKTGLKRQHYLDEATILARAQKAKQAGATRFCMAMAWRSPPKQSEFAKTLTVIKKIKDMGLETCLSMGMLTAEQAQALQAHGLDYYNHNLDTSAEYYRKIVTTRCYEDRLTTLKHVADSGLKTCCGGIVDMGESRADRVAFLWQLTQLDKTPESVPINRLVRVPGTPLAQTAPQDDFELVRTIATARILMPKAMIRLSAGRAQMNDSLQAWCFMAGANSLFYGEKLLTCANPQESSDQLLFKRLGLKSMQTMPQAAAASG
jgi:biotin synthase